MDADVPLFHGLLKFHHKLLHTIEKIQRRCNNCRIKTVIEDVEKKNDVLFVNLSFDGRKHWKKKDGEQTLSLEFQRKAKQKFTQDDLARLFIIAQKKSSSSTCLFNILMVENMNASHIFFLCKCQSFVLCGQRHTQLVFCV